MASPFNVTRLPDGLDDDDADSVPTDYTHALWGIESDAGDYLRQVALDLVADIARERDGAAVSAALAASVQAATIAHLGTAGA